jgi:hypothetical protein
MFMGPCIVRSRGGIYDQQDVTNSQYLLLEMLYIKHHFTKTSDPHATTHRTIPPPKHHAWNIAD